MRHFHISEECIHGEIKQRLCTHYVHNGRWRVRAVPCSETACPSGQERNEMTEVAVGQVWRDMAKDMIDRDRRLRITGIDGERATCIVDQDSHGTAGKTVKIATTRFGTVAFQLVEDPVPEAERDLYTRLLVAMSDVHGSGASPEEYARAALRVVRAAS